MIFLFILIDSLFRSEEYDLNENKTYEYQQNYRRQQYYPSDKIRHEEIISISCQHAVCWEIWALCVFHAGNMHIQKQGEHKTCYNQP